jgi:hypothetical protein
MKTVNLVITQDIIDNAEPSSTGACMVARALRQQLDGVWSIHVAAGLAKFNVGEMRYAFSVPARVSAAIIAFDKNPKEVKPFRCTLRRLASPARVKRKGPYSKRKAPSSLACNKGSCQRRYHGVVVPA